MKKILYLLCFLAAHEISIAQNTFPSSGNVGIGTTTPAQPLTIPITSNAQGISLGTYSSLSAGQFAFVGTTGIDGTFNGGNLTGVDNGSTGMAIIHTSGGTGNSSELAFVTHNNGFDSRERVRIDRLGNVGIGTTAPTQPLTIPITSNAQGISLGTYSSLSAGQFAFVGITGIDGTFNGGNLTGADNGSAGMAIIHTSGGSGNSAELAFVTHNNGFDSRERVRIDRLGNVAIGTTDPQGYKLAVAGNMIAESVKVKLQSNWPDYVFKEGYQLNGLEKLEGFIKENKHLPEIPSAAEVQKEGINLGEMNAKLLKKIEELTLYLIKQNKIQTDLITEVGKLKSEVTHLKSQSTNRKSR